MLLNSQKADLFNIILAHTLSPASFSLDSAHDEHGNRVGLRLQFKDSHFSFAVRPLYGQFVIDFSPGDQHAQEHAETSAWSEVQNEFNYWLINLAREINTPDPWRDLAKYSTAVPIVPEPETPNTPFTAPELQGIWKALGHIQEQLLNEAGGNKSHRKLVESQMKFLIDASERMGRKDWLMLAIGALAGVFTTLAIPAEAAGSILQILKGAVAGAFHLLG